MARPTLLPALAVLCLLVGGCSSSSTTSHTGAPSPSGTASPAAAHSPAAGAAPAASHATAHEAHFGYHGEEGPEHWGEVDPAWRTCGIGKQQSPVDLGHARLVDLPDPQLHYTRSSWHMVNTGHALMVTPAGGSTLSIGGTAWTLKQFHFHTPSEHVVDGRPAAGELHLVHADATGRLLVLGALLTSGGADNPGYTWLSGGLPREVGREAEVPGGDRDPRALLPASTAHRSYQGSLTTPPCTEGVTWLVMDQPVRLSPGQVKALHDLTGDNARPVQPLNGRTVQQDQNS